MKKSSILLTLASAGVACYSAFAQASYFSEQMDKLSKHYFELRPQVATFYGLPEAEAGLGSLSKVGRFDPQNELKHRNGIAAMLKMLAAMDKSQLTDSQKVTLALLQTEIKGAYHPSQVVQYGTILGEYGTWFLPYTVSHLSGFHVEFPVAMTEKFTIHNEHQAKAYLARLTQYPEVISGIIDKLEYDQKLGVIAPDFIIDKTLRNLTKQLSPKADQHPLVTSFVEKVKQAKLANTEALIKQVKQAVATGYYPATKQLMAKLTEQRKQAVHTAGIHRLPHGEALYQAMITEMTDTHLKPKAIHQLGLDEVKRIVSQMDVLLKKIGYNQGTVGERMAKLLKDPKYLYPDNEQGKAQLLADIKRDLALVDAKLPQWFGNLPKQQVAVKVVPPAQAESTSGAFYDAPSKDGTRPGTFWINLHDMSANPSYTLQTLTYHEANPGHHLQTVLGLSDDLPILSTVFYSNAAAEGWALYAERLASEMGIYDNDPVDDIGRLQAELHRAVRLVVDTGMHALGWSREQAIDYMIATEGVAESEAVGEVERYVVWPGQALGYKLGELKIRELRSKAKQALGDRFDIREFHDRLLELGALPLNIMQQKIEQWIASKQAK